MLVHTIHLKTMKPLSLFHRSSASKSKKYAAASPSSPTAVSSSSSRSRFPSREMTKFHSKDTLSDGGDIFEEEDLDGRSHGGRNEECDEAVVVLEEDDDEEEGGEDPDDDYSAEEVPSDLNSEDDEGDFNDEDEEYPPFPYYYHSPESLSPERRRLEFLQERDEDDDEDEDEEEDEEVEQRSERSDDNSSCSASAHENCSIDGAHDDDHDELDKNGNDIPDEPSAAKKNSHEMMMTETEIFPHLRRGFRHHAATAADENDERTSHFASEDRHDDNANIRSGRGGSSNSKVVGTLTRITRSVTRGRSLSIGRRRRDNIDNNNGTRNSSSSRGTRERKEYLPLEGKKHRSSGIKIHLHRSSNPVKSTSNEYDGDISNTNNDQQMKINHLHQLNRLGSAGTNNTISTPQLYLRASSSPASYEYSCVSNCSSALLQLPASDHVKQESSLSRYARRSRSLFTMRSRDNYYAQAKNTHSNNDASNSGDDTKPSLTASPRCNSSRQGKKNGESLKNERIDFKRALIHSSQIGLRHSSIANNANESSKNASKSSSGRDANNRRTKTRSLFVEKTGEEINTSLYSKQSSSSQNAGTITCSRHENLKDRKKGRSASLPHKTSSPPVKNYHYHIQNQNNYYNYDSNSPIRQGDDHIENNLKESVNCKKLKPSINSQESAQDGVKASSSSSKESITYSSSPSHKIHCAICRQRLHSKKEYIQFCNLYFCKNVDGVKGTCFKCACCRRSLDSLMLKRGSETNEVGSNSSTRPDLDILKWTKVTSNARGSIIQCGKCTMGSAFPTRSLNTSSDVAGNSTGPAGGHGTGVVYGKPTEDTNDYRRRPGIEQGIAHLRSQSAPHRVQAAPIEHDVNDEDDESSIEDNCDHASSRVFDTNLPQQDQFPYRQQNQQEYHNHDLSKSNNAHTDYVSSTDTDAAMAGDNNDLLNELHALRSENKSLIEQNNNLEQKNRHLTMAVTELSTVASTSKSMEAELIQQVASFVAQTNALTAEYQRLVDALTQKDMEIASLRYRNDCYYASSNNAEMSGNGIYMHTLSNGRGDFLGGGFGGQFSNEVRENECEFVGKKEIGTDEIEGLTYRPTCSSVPLTEEEPDELEHRYAFARSA